MKREAFSRYVFVSIVASSIEEIMLNGPGHSTFQPISAHTGSTRTRYRDN